MDDISVVIRDTVTELLDMLGKGEARLLYTRELETMMTNNVFFTPAGIFEKNKISS